MKIFVQWATNPPHRGEFMESTAWTLSPKRKLPTGGERIDSRRGWVNAVSCQGLEFSSYDHIAIEDQPDGACKITGWNDDPEDYPDDKYASVWRLYPLRRDPTVHGQWNTRQYCRMYGEPGPRLDELRADTRITNNVDPVVVGAWSEFVPPDDDITRHGIWLDDSLFASHSNKASEVPITKRGWRAWTDGVDARDLANGQVIVGR